MSKEAGDIYEVEMVLPCVVYIRAASSLAAAQWAKKFLADVPEGTLMGVRRSDVVDEEVRAPGRLDS